MSDRTHYQAEHGPDSQVVLVLAGDGVDFKAIEKELKEQCDSLPRGVFASKALTHSFAVFARDMVEVCPLTLVELLYTLLNCSGHHTYSLRY